MKFAWGIAFILFWIGTFHFYQEIEKKPDSIYVDLKDQLSYRLSKKDEWKKFSVKEYKPELPPNQKIWIRIQLPEFTEGNNFLYLEAIEVSARFYFEGKIFYNHGAWDKEERPSKFTNFFSAIIPVPLQASGKSIEVEIHADWKRIGIRRQVGIGKYQKIIEKYIIVDIPNIIFSFFYVILGLSCLILYSITKEKLVLYLGATSLPLGFACIAEMNFNLTNYLYFQFTPYLGWISYYSVVFFFFKFVEELYSLKNNLYFILFNYWLYAIFLVAWSIIYLYGFTYNYTAYLEIPFGLTLSTGGAIILFTSIYFFTKGNAEAKILLIGISIFILASLNYTFFMLTLSDHLEAETHLRFFPMILCSVWIIGLRYRKNQLLLQKYSDELEQSKLLLEEKVREKTRDLESANKMLVESDRSKTEFFANVSHEFKTPLTLILAPLEKLISHSKTDVENFLLDTIQRNAIRIKYLVEDLLAIAKLDFGVNQIILREVELKSYLNQLIKDFQILAEEKMLTFIAEIPENSMNRKIHKIEWDIIIRNILSNAIKFTNHGYIQFSFKIEGDLATIVVEDSGIGIEEYEKSKIFERFYRSERTLAKSIQGSGIGLNIVQRMIEICNGSIHVKSIINSGSCFTFQLPAYRTEVSDLLETDKEINLSYLQRRELEKISNLENVNLLPKILIVEDELDMVQFLSHILKQNYNCFFANNITEAKELLSKNFFELILCDWNLPQEPGIELLKYIKDRKMNIPFLFLTAVSDIQANMKAFSLGVDDFILKPFHIEDLLGRIQRQLTRSKENYQIIMTEKDKVYGDIHDIIGGQMFELHMLLDKIENDKPISPNLLDTIKNMTISCSRELRTKLHEWEDLQTIETNFDLGMKSMLFRRYDNLGRNCQLVNPSNEDWEIANSFSSLLKGEIYRLFLEISNNDIKYGKGDSIWKIHSLTPNFHLEMISQSNYNREARQGRGNKDLIRRTKNINGKLEQEIVNGIYHLDLKLPSN